MGMLVQKEMTNITINYTRSHAIQTMRQMKVKSGFAHSHSKNSEGPKVSDGSNTKANANSEVFFFGLRKKLVYICFPI